MKRLEDLLYWIGEREDIRLDKELGQKKPWSTDKTFQETYFCNIRREDDTVTKWIRENWDMIDDAPRLHVVAMALSRFVNKIETLLLLGYPQYGFEANYEECFIDVMTGGNTPWGSAYIVSTNGRKMPKAEYVASLMRDIDYRASDMHFTTLADAFKYLTAMQGIGSFMAGQIIADLKNTKGHPLAEAPDWWTWSSPGPGSLRGMEWLYDMGKFTPSMYYRSIDNVVSAVQNEGGHLLHAQDVQNCLCEFDKYMRVSTGAGRSKRKYNGA